MVITLKNTRKINKRGSKKKKKREKKKYDTCKKVIEKGCRKWENMNGRQSVCRNAFIESAVYPLAYTNTARAMSIGSFMYPIIVFFIATGLSRISALLFCDCC